MSTFVAGPVAQEDVCAGDSAWETARDPHGMAERYGRVTMLQDAEMGGVGC